MLSPRLLTVVIILIFLMILCLQALHVLLALKEPLTIGQVAAVSAHSRDA